MEEAIVEEDSFQLEDLEVDTTYLQRRRQTCIQRSIRRARSEAADRTLKRKVDLYKKWKEELKQTRASLREVETRVKRNDDTLKEHLDVLYKNYLKEHASITEEFKTKHASDLQKRKNVRKVESRQQQYVNRLKDELATMGGFEE